MFSAVALDPTRLAILPADIASKAFEFGVNLPLPGLGGESGGLGGALGGAVQQLLGGGEQAQPQAQEGPTPTPTPSQEVEQEEQPSIVPDAGKLLKGLFQ
jgi:hypothetical protein